MSLITAANLKEQSRDQINIKETIKCLQSINTCGWMSQRTSIYIGFHCGNITNNYSDSEVELSANDIRKNNLDFGSKLIVSYYKRNGTLLVKLTNPILFNHLHLHWLHQIPEINKEITRIKKQAKEILNSIRPKKKEIKKKEMSREIRNFIKWLPSKYKLSNNDLSEILSEIADEYLIKTVMDS